MLNQSICFLMLLMLSSAEVNAQQADSLFRKDKPGLVAFIPGTAAITYGFVALNNNALRRFDSYIHRKINMDHHSFHTNADDYLRYVPAAAVFGLDVLGVKGKNTFTDQAGIFVIATIFNNVSLGILKRTSNRERPNRLNDYSFPSGHSANAFANAEFLSQEYGDQSVWYTISGYGVATTTSVLRLYKDYHWFSDVIAGAGFGVLSTKFAYLIYPSVKRMIFKKKKSNLVFLPVYQNGGPAFALSGSF